MENLYLIISIFIVNFINVFYAITAFVYIVAKHLSDNTIVILLAAHVIFNALVCITYLLYFTRDTMEEKEGKEELLEEHN